MANTQGLPTYDAYRTGAMGAYYGTTPAWKAALYFASATIGPTTAAYTTTGEATGTGYTAGGVSVTHANAPSITGSTTYVQPSASISFGTITITAFDCVMIYDDDNSDRNLGVFTFSSQTIVAAAFTLNMPTNNSTTALMRWAWS